MTDTRSISGRDATTPPESNHYGHDLLFAAGISTVLCAAGTAIGVSYESSQYEPMSVGAAWGVIVGGILGTAVGASLVSTAFQETDRTNGIIPLNKNQVVLGLGTCAASLTFLLTTAATFDYWDPPEQARPVRASANANIGKQAVARAALNAGLIL